MGLTQPRLVMCIRVHALDPRSRTEWWNLDPCMHDSWLLLSSGFKTGTPLRTRVAEPTMDSSAVTMQWASYYFSNRHGWGGWVQHCEVRVTLQYLVSRPQMWVWNGPGVVCLIREFSVGIAPVSGTWSTTRECLCACNGRDRSLCFFPTREFSVTTVYNDTVQTVPVHVGLTVQ